jgi:hypothetical protein
MTAIPKSRFKVGAKFFPGDVNFTFMKEEDLRALVAESDFIELAVDFDKYRKVEGFENKKEALWKDLVAMKEFLGDKPVVIHGPHWTSGLNPSDKGKWDLCKELLDFSKKAADLYKAQEIILHPGYGEFEREMNVDFSSVKGPDFEAQLDQLPKYRAAKDNMYAFFDSYGWDPRFRMENCPLFNVYPIVNAEAFGYKPELHIYTCSTPQGLNEFCTRYDANPVIDNAHALVSVNFLRFNRDNGDAYQVGDPVKEQEAANRQSVQGKTFKSPEEKAALVKSNKDRLTEIASLRHHEGVLKPLSEADQVTYDPNLYVQGFYQALNYRADKTIHHFSPVDFDSLVDMHSNTRKVPNNKFDYMSAIPNGARITIECDNDTPIEVILEDIRFARSKGEGSRKILSPTEVVWEKTAAKSRQPVKEV